MSDDNKSGKRIMLKLSGEALMGELQYGIDPDFMGRIAKEISELVAMNVEVAIVIGGGNIFRGAFLAEGGMDRVTGDHIGMLATVINALSLQDSLERIGVYCRVMSALKINEVCEDYIRRRAVRHLEKGRVVIFASGTGNPFFTTDTAASLRAVEMSADIMMKATKVDGIYDMDPNKYDDAKKINRITYDEVIQKKLAVMDTTAIVMCRDHNLPLKVFNMNTPGEMVRAVVSDSVGSIVESGDL
ncbi:UMP kinase [Chromatiales bacterium (ex Bugula neritina AB1)]|nr:UMP kinase [Chromatiales bacterium (ex Bugula neritina AB1)]